MSSLRTAPILGDGANKAAKGARRKTLRRSRLVCHAKINRTAYPPREAMLQRIRNKAAESLKQRIQEVEVSEAAKVEAVNQDLVVRHRSLHYRRKELEVQDRHTSFYQHC